MVIPASGLRQYSIKNLNVLEQANIMIDQPRQLDGNVVLVGGTKRKYGVYVLGTSERWSCRRHYQAWLQYLDEERTPTFLTSSQP